MSEFKSVLIEDNLTGLLSSEITFGVQSAGKANYQQFVATSVSNSTIQFNAQIPNQSVVLDRNALLSTTVYFTLKYGSVPAGSYAFSYGYDTAFGSYPLNSLFTTISSTINNVSVNANVQDILACLLRMNDNPLISETNTRTASLPDFYYNSYKDGVGASNNPLGSINQSSYDAVYFGRGSLPLKVLSVVHVDNSDPLLPVIDTSLLSASLTDTWVIQCSVDLIEPFIALSPFTNNSKNQEAGLYGINQISMNINIDTQMRRFWRESRATYTSGTNTTPSYLTSIALGCTGYNSGIAFQNCQLLMKFVSMTPDQVRRLGSSRNCVPYMEFPRYLSVSSQNSIISAVVPASLDGDSIVQPIISTATLISSNIQLSVVPDKIIIGVRIPMSSQNSSNTDSWLPITKCVVLFNSNSGILSSATVSDLYKLSRRNGSSQNYFEFSGVSSNNNQITTAITYSELGGYQPIYTTGSLLILDPVRDFSLDDWLSASSSGAFNFQVQLTVQNTYSFPVQPEIIIITQQSGIFSTTEGVSATEVGILTKEVVLSTRMNEKPESMMMEGEFERLVGGRRYTDGTFNNMAHRMHRRYNTGYTGMSHKGGGVSGGVVSGGVMSGGRLGKYIR